MTVDLSFGFLDGSVPSEEVALSTVSWALGKSDSFINRYSIDGQAEFIKMV